LLHPKVASTPYHEVRLFRCDDRIRFRGVMREAVLPAIEEVGASDGLTIADSDVHLYHVGYEGDLTHKFERNLPLLEREVEAAPERVFLWVDMAQSLLGLGRIDEAQTACWKAIAAAEAYPDSKQKYDASLAWEMLVRSALVSDAARAAVLATQALAAFPEQHTLRLACAEALFANVEAGSVLPLLLDSIKVDPEAFVDPMVAYDKRIFGEWAYNFSGAVYVRLGRRSEAAAAFTQAAGFAPDSPVYRIKAAAFSSSRVS
jgi:tetratricopeptide (TPR) repeat protein